MKPKMTFARLQERVGAAAGIPPKEARVLMKEMAAAVEAGLVDAGKVNLAGLGRFSRKVWGLLSYELWHQCFHDQAARYRSLVS